jgi:hypothetical protein
VGALDRRVPVGVVADGQLADPGLARPAVPVVGVEESALRLHGDHEVGEPPGDLARAVARHRHPDRRRLVGKVPEPGVLHVEVGAVTAHVPALEERPDDVEGLLQHLQADVGGGPARAHHVLAEILARAQAQPEPPLAQQLHRRGLLGHDRRVVPDGGTRHVGHERDPGGGLRGRPEHTPGVRRVALALQPGEVVVRGHGEVETRLLRPHHVRHQVPGAGLLRHHRVSEVRHVPRVAGGRGGETSPGRRPVVSPRTPGEAAA